MTKMFDMCDIVLKDYMIFSNVECVTIQHPVTYNLSLTDHNTFYYCVVCQYTPGIELSGLGSVTCSVCNRYFCEDCARNEIQSKTCKRCSPDGPHMKIMEAIKSQQNDQWVPSLKTLALLAIPKKQMDDALDYLALGKR